MSDNNFCTPVGRLVGGSVGEAFLSKDDEAKGKKPQFFVAVAVPKTDPNVNALISKIQGIAAAAWVTNPKMLARPDFAWKIRDGDSEAVNKKGDRWCDKEGYAGHWVFSCETLRAPQTVNDDHSPRIGTQFKRGDFVRVAGYCKGSNGSDSNPGLYLTHTHVMFVREGDPIGGTAMTSQEAFGAAPTPAHDVVQNALGSTPQLTDVAIKQGLTWEQITGLGLTEEAARNAGWVK